jgi:hypothetical protein
MPWTAKCDACKQEIQETAVQVDIRLYLGGYGNFRVEGPPFLTHPSKECMAMGAWMCAAKVLTTAKEKLDHIFQPPPPPPAPVAKRKKK